MTHTVHFCGLFGLNLICYRMEEIVDNATREMLKGIMESLDGVKAYQI